MTETCISCGDIELYYVLSCGDANVGDSTILMFAGPDKVELQAEIAEIDSAFRAIHEAAATDSLAGAEQTVAAQDHMATMLSGYIDPDVQLPGKHMVQAYNLRGRRWTFIRSDKMQNHARSYPIDKSLLNATQDGLDQGALRQAFQGAREKIASDLGQGFDWKGEFIKVQVGGTITDLWDGDFMSWVDAVNESMAYSSSSPYHDLSAGAQLMRGYAGFGVQAGYNPAKNSYGLTGNADARAVLAEAKTTITGYVPHVEGWYARAPFADEAASEAGRQTELNFGYFRGTIELKATAMLGASIMATAGVEYVPQSDGSTQVKPASAGAKGEISAGAFVGVEAGGEFGGSIEWMNPGWRLGENGAINDQGWKKLVGIGVQGAVNAGAGGQIDLYITFENGKFMFRAKAQLVWGVGAKGGLSGVIGLEGIMEFVMYTYHQLRYNGFSYLQFIDRTAFKAMVNVTMYAIQYGEDAINGLGAGLDRIGDAIMAPIRDRNDTMAFARRIRSQPRMLMFAPPEVKGAILHRLTRTFASSWDEEQEPAVMAVLGSIHTRREWEQVVERITQDGSKSSAAAGMSRLNWLMDGAAQREFNARVLEMLSSYDVIDPIPLGDTRFAGSPVAFRNMA